MLAKVQIIMQMLEQLAPECLAEEWDNVGLQIGDPQAEVKKILVALDVDDAVVGEEAVSGDADMVVAHHPLLYKPLSQIRYDLPLGRMVRRLVQSGAAVYIAHTNLDTADCGVNTALAELIGLVETRVLQPLTPEKIRELTLTHPGRDWGDICGLGRIGCLPASCHLEEFVRDVKTRLGGLDVRVCGERSRIIRKVAVCGGSGAGLAARAAWLGADVLVTGDVKYHDAQAAERLGVAVIDAGHAATEQPVVPFLAELLRGKLEEAGYTTAVAEAKGRTQFWQG